MRYGRTVEAEALIGLLKIAPDDIGEDLGIDGLAAIEEIDVKHRDRA